MRTVDQRLRGVFGSEERRRSRAKRWGIGRRHLSLAPREVLRAGEHGARRGHFGLVQVMDRMDGCLEGEDTQHQREAESDHAAARAAGPQTQQADTGDECEPGPHQVAGRKVDRRKLETADLSPSRMSVQEMGSRRVRHRSAGSKREGQRDERSEGHRAPVTSSHGELRVTLRAGPEVVKAGP